MAARITMEEPSKLTPTLQQWFDQGVEHFKAGQWDEAEALYRRIVAERPDYPDAHYNLGIAFRKQRKLQESLDSFRRTVTLRPTFTDAWINAGNTFHDLHLPERALEAYRQALAVCADLGLAWTNMGVAFKETGQLDAAMACYDRGLTLNPDDSVARSSKIYTLCFHPGYDNEAIFREARQWNDRFAKPLGAEIPSHDNEASPDRRLRIGYVSPDFRRHCASMFTIPLLAHHDHLGFEIFCYSNVSNPDTVTAKHQRRAYMWRDISKLSDDAAAQLIRQDKIDILVDMALHMAGNRLLLFARRPAPVQVTWLGYAGTTGLDAIDYRLTDPRLDPLGSHESEIRNPEFSTKESYYSERSIRLPDTFWCYDPRGIEDSDNAQMPEPGPLPALAAGRVTLGCLNNFCKVTQPALALWARVLAAVPGSQMVLASPLGAHRAGVVEKLGVGPQRVQFVPFQSWRQYLETYCRIDICLDAIPCNGGTTSLDGLWMGVPLVTQIGRTAVGRAGSSLLHNLGLPELIARTDEQFVQAAVGLAGDLNRLGDLRSTLRRRLEHSPLMDGPRFARNLEAAYRRMWQVWCRERS